MVKKNQHGQTLIIIVLMMVIALTVGLSVVSRTVINLKISKQTEESQRALQAAEAGIEQALKQDSAVVALPPGGGDFVLNNNASFNVNISQVTSTSLRLNGNLEVNQDKGVDVWLSDYPDFSMPQDVTVNIYWGIASQNNCVSPGNKNTVPALEIIILQDLASPNDVRKFVYDDTALCIPNRINGSTPAQAGGDVGSGTDTIALRYSTGNITINRGKIMKIIPLFNSAQIGVRVISGGLPSQGKEITSTGKSGDVTRKIKFFSPYPQIPVELFPYSIMAQGFTPI